MNYLDYFDEGGKSRTMEYYILPNKQQQQRNVDRNSIALDVIYRLLSKKLKQKSNDKETNAQSTQNTSNNNSYSRNSQLANTPFGPAYRADTFRIGDRDIFIYHQ